MISSIQEELKTSKHPIAKAIHKSAQGRTICIGFVKGMQLTEHKAHLPTTLLVLKGSIQYREVDKVQNLHQFEQYEIPVGVVHAVDALEDSLILLVQG